MKKIYLPIFLSVLLIELLIPNQYVSANSLENDYLSIKLTSPIESKNLVKLYSEDGFAIYRKDDILNELEYFEDQYINIGLDEEGKISIMDSFNNILYSFRDDNLALSSRNGYDKKIKVEDKNYRGNISKLILDEIVITDITDYYQAFEIELENRELGKNILRFNL